MAHALRQRLILFLVFIALLVTANVIILWTPPSLLRALAGLALLYALPGLAWLAALGWLGTRQIVERIVLVGALGSAVASVAMLAAVYWPQPLDLTQTLIGLDAATLLGISVCLVGVFRQHQPRTDEGAAPGEKARHHASELIILLAILGVAAFLRWYSLGYSEFHEDEIENMQYAVRAMKGEEHVVFLDSKGPIHWLLPAALWFAHGWTDEGLARSPFALSSTLTVLAAYALARRMFGPPVALASAGFLAVNGLLISSYARQVEIPGLLFLWGMTAAWCVYRWYESRGTPGGVGGRLLVVASFLLAVGLVGHPNMSLYVPPFVLAVGLACWRNPDLARRTWKAMATGIVLLAALAAAFYVPWLLDPNFKHSVEYFSQERVGTGFLYNQMADLLQQDNQYSSRFFAPLIVFFSAVAIFGQVSKVGRAGRWLAFALVGVIATVFFLPGLWVWGPINAAFVPLAVLFGIIVISPTSSYEARSLALWFGVLYVVLVFFARDAAEHISHAHLFWALWAGSGFVTFWQHLRGNWGRAARVAVSAVLGACCGLILYYQDLQYLSTTADYWRVEANAKYDDQSLYRTVYGKIPRPRKMVGNPRLEGWKVVGVLYDGGELQGDYRFVKESFTVPVWYTYDRPRSCFDDTQNVFVARTARGLPEEFERLPDQGYGLTRVVLADGEPRIYMFAKGQPSAEPPATFSLDDYRIAFDTAATPARFTQEPPSQNPLRIRFGATLQLNGYDIVATRLSPGDVFDVFLHWQALHTADRRYRAFVHVESERMWGQYDDDPVCRLRTDEWRPPQAGIGQFRVQLDPATPRGVYPVTVGVYDPETGDRLEAVGEDGRSLGSVIEVTKITVE